MDFDGPALAPPDSQVSNFDNPPNRNALAWGVLLTCSILTSICYFLRIYARVFLARKFQAEEALATLAFGAFWGAAVATFKLIETPGYFVHQWNVRLRDVTTVNYWVFVFGVCLSIVLPLVKVAILREWIRIFVPHGWYEKSALLWGCLIVMFVQLSSGIAIVIALNLQCTPHNAIWELKLQLTTAKCWDLNRLQLASVCIHLMSDVVMLALPQHTVWKLKMKWQKKLAISFLFSLGILACVSATFRLAVTVAYGKSDDAVYNIGPIGFWGMAEMTCGFFIASTPCIPKTLKESGALRKIKMVMGIKTQTTKTGSEDLYSGGLSSGGGRSNTGTNAAYYKLSDQGVPLKNMQGTESTEYLQESQRNITRTITVVQDSQSSTSQTKPPGVAPAWA